MRTALEQVGAINGVLGAYISRQGQIQASSLPLIFRADVIGAASQPLLSALSHINEVSGSVEVATIHFGDVYLVAAPLEPDVLFVVVGQPHTDLAQLRREIQRIQAGPGLRASESATEPSQPPHPSGMTTQTAGVTGSGDNSKPPRTPPEPNTPERSRGVRSSSLQKPLPLEDEVRARLQQILSHFVGPVAPLLLDDQLRSGSSPTQLVERLAREIESAEDREDFLTRVAELQLWSR